MKVRCYDPKFLKEGKKQKGYNCKNFDKDTKLCKVKEVGGGKNARVFPSKPRKCDYYSEEEI